MREKAFSQAKAIFSYTSFMIENTLLSGQRIINCLSSDYGIKITTLTFLPLGADMNASAYRAETYEKSTYFVKIMRGCVQDVSVLLLGLLQDAGVQQIVPPIKTSQGQLAQQLDDFTLVVYPFVEGQDGFSRNLTDAQWVLLGKLLRQVHEMGVPPSIQAMIRREDYSPQWREAVRSLYAYIESEPHCDDVALKFMLFMKKHTVAIHRLMNRAEQLGRKVQNQNPEFVLCHSDIHGGNVLMDNNHAIYVVDWDHPIIAPKECDLMFIGGGVANVWNKPQEIALFYEGYGKTEVNSAILAYYRHERIVEDIAVYGQQILLTKTAVKDKMISYKHFVSQFEPGGVVEIAFKTDES